VPISSIFGHHGSRCDPQSVGQRLSLRDVIGDVDRVPSRDIAEWSCFAEVN
jgi:hypothetical protein